MAAADLEQAVGQADLQSVDRPDEPLSLDLVETRTFDSRVIYERYGRASVGSD